MRIMQCICFYCHPFRAGLSPEVNLTFLLADVSSFVNKLLKNNFNSEPRLTNSLRCSWKGYQGQDILRQLFLDDYHGIYIYISLTKREVKMAGYWPSSLFAFLWTETKSFLFIFEQ